MMKETREGTDAIQCDRCGTMYRARSPHAFLGWHEFNLPPALKGSTETVDICPRCVGEFSDWWGDFKRQWDAQLEKFRPTDMRPGAWNDGLRRNCAGKVVD